MRRSIAFSTLAAWGLFLASSVQAFTYSSTLTIVFGDSAASTTAPNPLAIVGPVPFVLWDPVTASGAEGVISTAAAVSGPSATAAVRSLSGTRGTTSSNAAFVGTPLGFNAAFARLDVALGQPMPEPATLWLSASGILGLSILGTRRQR